MSSMSFLHVILFASDQKDTWLFEAQLRSLQKRQPILNQKTTKSLKHFTTRTLPEDKGLTKHLPQTFGQSFNLKNQDNTVPQQRHETYTYNGSNSF